MINFDKLTTDIKNGLKQYLFCPVMRGNQLITPPKFPYIVFNMTALDNGKGGTWQQHDDGIDRNKNIITLSFTTHSDKYEESLELSIKAREWLDYVGKTYLNERGIIVQSVTAVHDRSNFLTTEYMYSYGFDCFIWLYDEVNHPTEEIGTIETAELSGQEIK